MSKRRKSEAYKKNVMARSEEARTVRKIVAIIIFAIILIITIGGISGYNYIKSSLEPVDPSSDEQIQVEIPLGSSSSSIANILEESGVIKDSRIFRFYIKFKNQSNFQAGEYTFTPSNTIDEIIETLKSGRVILEPIHTITIPEGKTIEQMAEIYSSALHFNKDEFLEKLNDKNYIEGLINKYPSILSDVILDPEIRTPLEGYLFAATYQFYEQEPSIESIVENMLNKTVEVIQQYQNEIQAIDYSIHEAITFASLLENEARNEEERRLIAGIFYNRLEEGMPLQTDPTVLYALGEHKDTVLYKDLEVDSPYNTYVIQSLPIGPISNFGVNALEATVHPEETDYMYFLHDYEGNIFYSVTYDEHLKLREKHRPNNR